jgi:hypothetical protein
MDPDEIENSYRGPGYRVSGIIIQGKRVKSKYKQQIA